MPNLINFLAADCFMDGSGSPILEGKLTLRPSSPFKFDDDGQASTDVLVRAIAAGSMVGELEVADTSSSSPVNVGWTVTVKNLKTNIADTYENVPIIADGSGNFNWATLDTGLYVNAKPFTLVVGPRGPAGGSAAPLDLTAAVNISGSLAVAAIGGDAVLADSSTLAHRDCVIGLATVTTLSGQPVEVQFEGEFTFSSWNWTLGLPVVLGLNGALTQAIPTTGFLQIIGTPLSSTSLLLNLQPPITLA